MQATIVTAIPILNLDWNYRVSGREDKKADKRDWRAWNRFKLHVLLYITMWW